jgi:hypothetical protein
MAPEPHYDWQTCAASWFTEYGDRILAALVRTYPQVDSDLRYNAVVDAIMELAQKPEAFDPERGNLLNFLIGAACRALTSPRRSDASRRVREQEKAKRNVARHESAARDILDVLADKELAPMLRDEIAQTDEEKRYLALREDDIDDPAQIAHALGIEHLAPDEQAASFQRTHKRLMKRMERIRQRRREEGNRP